MVGRVLGRLRGLGAVGLLALVLLGGTPGAASALAPAVSAKQQQLLETYAPVMAIRTQAEQCKGDERFLPMSVDYVLGRDDVVLRDADGEIVVRAPTAKDLAGRGPDHWLDFPGNALKPGCDYEKWFRTFDAEPSIYGRLTKDGDTLVAQYWFYWAFNQWNDVHESDWEMIQLQFDTDDVDEALRKGPSRYAYAQHEGAEYADAGDDKVELVDDTHPIVYSSGGSHASYYSSTRWFGKSGATGFGCDDTTGPIERISPTVIALPRQAPTTGEFAWLSYQGHWGQQERFFNDGPSGPAAKPRWDEPLAWVAENGREASVSLPFARSGATQTFCSLSATGSSIFNSLMDDPAKVVVVTVLVLAAVTVVVRFGSRGVLGRAARTWWRGKRRFLLLGAVTFATGALALLAQYAVIELTVLGRVVDVVGGSSPWVLPLVALAGALVAVPLLAWVVAATVLVEGGEPSVPAALRTAGGRDRGAVLRSGAALVAVIGLTLFIIPLFVILAAQWLVAPVASSREGLPAWTSLVQSRRLLKGRRWRSLALAVTLCLVLAIGGVLGALVLAVTSLGFAGAALVVAAANAILIPYVALVGVHYYEVVTEVAPTPERETVDA